MGKTDNAVNKCQYVPLKIKVIYLTHIDRSVPHIKVQCRIGDGGNISEFMMRFSASLL